MSTDFNQKLNDLITMNCGSSAACQNVWALIGNLINTVHLDEDRFVSKLEAALSGKSGEDQNVVQNIFNSIMELFGLTRIPKDLKERLGKENGLHQFLDIDMSQAGQQAAAITEAISSLVASDAAKASHISQLEALLSETRLTLDKICLERDTLLKERAAHDKDMLHAFQRMIAKNPDLAADPDAESDPMAAYLDDQGITWSWDDAKNPEDFTAYVISDESLVGVRLPCLYRGDAVAVKGLKYTLKN